MKLFFLPHKNTLDCQIFDFIMPWWKTVRDPVHENIFWNVNFVFGYHCMLTSCSKHWIHTQRIYSQVIWSLWFSSCLNLNSLFIIWLLSKFRLLLDLWHVSPYLFYLRIKRIAPNVCFTFLANKLECHGYTCTWKLFEIWIAQSKRCGQ